MHSNDMHEAIENDNLNLFPNSFPFFDYVLSHPPIFIYFSNAVLFLSLLQQYFSLFLPILAPLFTNNDDDQSLFHFFTKSSFKGNNIFLNFILYSVQYTSNIPQFSTYDSLMIFYFLPSFLIILFNLFMYSIFRQNDEIPSFICQIRCLLFLFIPSLSIFPIAIRLSFALKSFFFDEEINDTIITCEIILGVVFLLILAAFTNWSLPIISHSPIYGKGQIPSHLITDSSFITKTQLIDIANVCACIIGKDDISILIYIIIAFINSIYKFQFVINFPFLSVFHSAAVCSVSFSSSICLLIIFFQILNQKFSEVVLLLVSIILLISTIIIFYYFLLYLEKKKVNVITSKNYELIKPSLISAYFQSAVINGILSPQFVEYAITNHPEPNSPQYLIGMLISEKVGLKSFSEMISSILNTEGITFSQKYFVYLIYTKYIRNSEKQIDFHGLIDIENSLDAYNKNSDDFWTLMLLGKTNKALKIASNNESKLTQLLRNYNLYYQASPNNQYVKDLHQQFFYNFVKTPVNSEIQFHSKIGSQESLMSTIPAAQPNLTISYNLKKALDQHIPLFLVIIRLIGFICFLIFITASMFPIFQLSRDSSVLLNLTPALNHSLNIALLFSKMNIAAANAFNCSHHSNIYCDDILNFLNAKSGDPSIIHDNFIKFADDLIVRLNLMTNQFSNLVQNQYLTELTNSWSKPSVTLFPYSDLNSTRSIKVDINSALLLFAGQIKENSLFDSFLSVDSAYPNVHDIYNRSSQVQIGINRSFYHYNDYTKALVSLGAGFFNKTETILIIIFGFLSIAVPWLCRILSEKRSYIILNKYFRPFSHPNEQLMNIKSSKTVEPFKWSHSYRYPLFVWIIATIVTFLTALIFSNHLSPIYDIMMSESQMLICLERLSSYISLISETLMRNVHFPNEKDVVDLFNSLKNDKLASMKEFYNSMSQELIHHIRDNTLLQIMKERYEITSRENLEIYSSMNFIQQCEFFFFLLHTHNLSEINQNISFHMLHMYMSQISNGFIQVGDLFTRYSLDTRESFLAVLLFGLIVYFIIVISTFSITLSEVFKILHLQRQISRFFLVLSPSYVAQNNCLMDYIVDKEEKVTKKVADTYLSLYDNTEIALIVINDRFSITSFTQATLRLFSYRAEQLIGQQIDLLFPKDIESNDIQFFQHISIVKKKQAENSFTRTLTGMASYGEEIQFKVKITAFNINEEEEENNNVFFVLECISEQQRCYYDELIQKHIDLFNEYFQLSEPVWMFSNLPQTENQILIQHFTKFAMVCVFAEPDDNRADFINHLSVTLPSFSGVDGEIIYYYTDISCLAFFVDLNADYLINAYNFFFNFGKNCCGFIVEGVNIDLAFFPLPQTPEEYRSTEMPNEVALQYQASMTVEPMTKMMMNIPPLTRMCRSGKLICTDGILGLTQNTDYQVLENAIDMSLFMIDV